MTILGVAAAIFFAFWLRSYPIHGADGDNGAPWGAYLYVISVLALLHLLGACAVEAEPQRYTCTVVYRCAGAADLEARLAMPCATSEAEAEQLATDAAIVHAEELCGAADAWATVRPLCTLYDPATACELTDDVAEQ